MSSSSYWAYNSPVYPCYFNPNVMVNPGDYFAMQKQMSGPPSDTQHSKQGHRKSDPSMQSALKQPQMNVPLPASKRERVVIKVVDPDTNEDLTSKLADMYDAVNTRASTPDKDDTSTADNVAGSHSAPDDQREPIKPFSHTRDKTAVQRVEPRVWQSQSVPSSKSPKTNNKNCSSAKLPEVTCILNENKEIVQVFSDSSAVIEDYKLASDSSIKSPKEQLYPSTKVHEKSVTFGINEKLQESCTPSSLSKDMSTANKNEAILPKSATWGNKFSKVNQKTPIAAAIVKPMPIMTPESSTVGSSLDEESYPTIVTTTSVQPSLSSKAKATSEAVVTSKPECHLTPSCSTTGQKLSWSSAMKKNSPNALSQTTSLDKSSEKKFNFNSNNNPAAETTKSTEAVPTSSKLSNIQSVTTVTSSEPTPTPPPTVASAPQPVPFPESNNGGGSKETSLDDDGFQEVKQKRKPPTRQSTSFKSYKQSSNSVPSSYRSESAFGDAVSRNAANDFGGRSQQNSRLFDRERSFNPRGRQNGRGRWQGGKANQTEENEPEIEDEVETTIVPSYLKEKHEQNQSTSWADEVEVTENRNDSAFSWSKIVKSGATKPGVALPREKVASSDQPAWAVVDTAAIVKSKHFAEDNSRGKENWRSYSNSDKSEFQSDFDSTRKKSQDEPLNRQSSSSSSYSSRRRERSPEESNFDRLVHISHRSSGKISTFSRSPSPVLRGSKSNADDTDNDNQVSTFERRRNDSKSDRDKSRPVNIVNPMKYDD